MFDKIDIDTITDIAQSAGDAIMEIYDRDFRVEYKEDSSPLTEADIKSNEIICSALEAAYPEIPILSEENREIPYPEREDWEYYWCIDPIDGTKEFVKRNGEFTVNIALIHRDTPVLGVVYAPVLGDMYRAKRGEGAFKNGQLLPLEINATPDEYLRVVASKSHLSEETQAFIDQLAKETNSIEQVSKGSSLKLVMIAEGDADIYPRMAPTMEWDTAAADAIVRESGKMSYQYDQKIAKRDQKPLVYNKRSLLNPWFIVK
ncbi:MAG: 3'(2'),5'-bisphosphate nucleotidase CysQ [Campylobacterota bacterium]|nr:3'(2'),5'-bisphosphate nucleotidase CysQ [Campylobacterota bacterium]